MNAPVRGMERGRESFESGSFFGKNECTSKGYGEREREKESFKSGVLFGKNECRGE